MSSAAPKARKPAGAADGKRRADLAAIHMAQKALGLSREDAEAVKLAITGKSSAADMTAPQRAKLLAHLSAQQERAGVPRPRRPAPPPGVAGAHEDWHAERWFKCRAIWTALHDAGAVRSGTDASLMAYVARQTGVDQWQWLNGYQMNTVVESLKKWAWRVGARGTL